MIKRMQHVFPIVMMLQMDVIKDYGFSEGRHGRFFYVHSLVVTV